MSGEYEQVDHPRHYGGASDPFEAIKVIEAWRLSFCLGSAVKYLCRAGRKPGVDALTDVRKARWYLDREIQRLSVTTDAPRLLEPEPGTVDEGAL